MSKPTCKTCLYFHQHYTLKGGKLLRIFCGHCIFPKVKHKDPHTQACDHYTPGDADENAFASKKYLTKEMIRQLFEMEFLPQIDDCTE